ncbi:hypothetical protein ACERZ8_03465 [Tateyamaria armeniaca]|uniref:Peptidase C1A papain C-terminal domain-containing protein n=1 Tax=Tateyamaria armeniaca TaxID=2518930 RepID=A0ABW8UTJ3_9RHOB
MAQRRYVFGGAVPPGWSASVAIDIMRSAKIRLDNRFFKTKDLVGGLIRAENWQVRDQGERGTCNAFAVAAAEELREFNLSGKLNDLSEEYLYGKMRSYGLEPLSDIGMDVSHVDTEAIEESGGTFLEQARKALSEWGICSEDLAEYQKHAEENTFEDNFSENAINQAQENKIGESLLDHDIVSKPVVGIGKPWLRASTNRRISEVLAEKIQSGLPVAASFAVLSGTGKQAWTGRTALKFGKVEYPTDEVAKEMIAIGGHSVCLVGFVENHDPSILHGGWFVFRNSHGEDGFATSIETDEEEPKAPAAGYGLISTHDVDRYCWEYLARTSSGSGHPVF